MKSRYQVEELGKHVHQVSSRNRSGADTEVFSVTNSEGFTRSTEYFSKEVFSKDVSNYKVVKPYQFAYNPSRINVGSIDYLRHSSSVLVSPLYIVFECSKDIHTDYLLRYLKSDWGNAQIRANTEGAVRNSLKYKGLEKIKFPFAPLNDQIRIALLLSRVEGLIAQRKQHLQQLDDLFKSVFLEMFGDPVRNEKEWDVVSLSSYGSFKNGLNFGKGESGISVRYLGVGDFKAKARLDDIEGLSFVELNELPSEEYFLKEDDLLFVRSNGNRELVGRCMAVYPAGEKVTYSGFIIRYRIGNPDLKSTYLVHLFRSVAFRRVLFQGGQGANIQNINQQILSGLPVPLPPEELQNQFATIVEKVEALKSHYQQSINDLEALYGSLSQQAFKGELDLSRVPLPAAKVDAEVFEAHELVEAHIEEPLAINLPNTDYLLDALTNEPQRERLMAEWLQSYRQQMGNGVFDPDDFLAAAQTRITELHPDNEFEFGIGDYDTVKNWVFDALEAGTLTQRFDEANNRLSLAVGKPA